MSKNRTILIVSDIFDVHADIVEEKLLARGSYVFRLDCDVVSLCGTAVRYVENGWCIEQREKRVLSSEVSAVWCRRSAVSLTSEQEADTSNGFRLWRAEWNRALFGIYRSLSSVYWLNHIRSATLADNKFYQMDVAKKCGLIYPETIVSNCKSDLIEFARAHRVVALKFMSQDIYRNQEGSTVGLYVNRLDESDLEEFGGVSENPVTLQRYIEKDYEVRYTFVDGDHFVCRIDSQSSRRANIDWRRYDIPHTPHAAMEPPRHVRDLVARLMGELDLHYGALDFIVDKDGLWWFLEVNSTGQWLWIEDLAGLPISDSIADCLVRNTGRENGRIW